MAGRRPKPTALKVLQGNPGKRKLNHSEPTTRRGAPDRPLFLTQSAIAAWDHIVPLLLEMNVLTTSDGFALTNLCMAFARWQEAEEAITRHGVVYEHPIVDKHTEEIVGYVIKKNPACTVAMACQKEMRAQLSAFGLDPSSRSRIKGATQETQKSALVSLLEAQQAARQKKRS
jgi:P27 family predicted phage terminase small subunit